MTTAMFIVAMALLKDWVLVKQRALSWRLRGHLPMNAINILQLGKIHHQTNSVMTFN